MLSEIERFVNWVRRRRAERSAKHEVEALPDLSYVYVRFIRLPTVMFFKRPPCLVATPSTVAVSVQLK
jgi:hypothetical protein